MISSCMQYQPQCKLHRQVPLPFAGSSCAAPLPQRAQTPRALAAQRPPHNWHAVEQPWLAARNGAHPHAPPLLLQPHQGWLAAGESSCCRHCRRRRHCRWLLQAAPPPALADAAAVAALGQAQRCRRAACPCAGAGAGAKGRIRSVRLCAGRSSRSDWVDTMLTCGSEPRGHSCERRTAGAQQSSGCSLQASCILWQLFRTRDRRATDVFWHARRQLRSEPRQESAPGPQHPLQCGACIQNGCSVRKTLPHSPNTCHATAAAATASGCPAC